MPPSDESRRRLPLAAAARSLYHTGINILPHKRLDTSTQRLEQSDNGIRSLLLCLFFVLWFAVGNALVGQPNESDVFSSLAFSTCFVAGITFVLYKAAIPQQQCVPAPVVAAPRCTLTVARTRCRYFDAWAQLKQYPQKLYHLRDSVQEAEGVALTKSQDSGAAAAAGSARGGGKRRQRRQRRRPEDGHEERKGVEGGGPEDANADGAAAVNVQVDTDTAAAGDQEVDAGIPTTVRELKACVVRSWWRVLLAA